MPRKPAKVKLPPATKRNIAAKQARDQKAGAMKDKRGGRGGAKNVMREDLREAD
ncbi:MAG: hypothetical protein U0Q16_13215 [Bryobacteraceae bacterium]